MSTYGNRGMPDALQLQRNRSALLRAQRRASRAAALARRDPMTEPRNTGLRKVAALTIHLGPEQSAVLGYGSVSREGQDLAQQRAALRAAGCARLFEEKASGGCNSTRRSQSSDPR